MSFHKKHLLPIFITLITISIILILSLTLFLSTTSTSELAFSEFINHYTSKDIDGANRYILNSSLPNINNLFAESLQNPTNTQLQNQIIKEFEQLFYSIDYKIISSKTFFNSSTLNINFTYNDLSKQLINFFTNQNQNDITYENFIKSLNSQNYKIFKNINVELIKKNKEWKIILSNELINVLTAGLRNFEI